LSLVSFIRHVLQPEELNEKSNMQKMHTANSDRPVAFYSLDVILAVGYRSNSPRASEFRRWASDILKQYVVSGVAINDRRLLELEQVVRVMARSADPQLAGTAEIVASYLPAMKQLRCEVPAQSIRVHG
jgi:prophage antirepressor-like protein